MLICTEFFTFPQLASKESFGHASGHSWSGYLCCYLWEANMALCLDLNWHCTCEPWLLLNPYPIYTHFLKHALHIATRQKLLKRHLKQFFRDDLWTLQIQISLVRKGFWICISFGFHTINNPHLFFNFLNNSCIREFYLFLSTLVFLSLIFSALSVTLSWGQEPLLLVDLCPNCNVYWRKRMTENSGTYT